MTTEGRVKNAVVTGGASGIGAAVADRLRADGLQVAIIDLNPGEAKFSYAADVTDRAAVDGALAEIRAELGPVTVLVNAAGLDRFKKFLDLSFDEWQKVVDVNLNGVFHCTQAVLPDMIEAGWGRIVNISSSSTHSGQPFMSPYVAAKSAVSRLASRWPWVRPARHHRQCGAARLHRHPDVAQSRTARLSRRHRKADPADPVRRMGLPEDIAAACAFFISEEAGYITGQILGVNGGRNT